MCGICGMTQSNAASLRAMSAALVHRGPDDEGLYVDPGSSAGLAARRLSIIDVDGGHQPLSNEDGSIWAVLNGEIYNFPALRRRLAGRGHTLATACDTEVLVHLYEDFGAELVHALEGMFAFAIWDARTRTLVLARDRFGEKPLFYRDDGKNVAFASELSALVSGLDAAPSLDEDAIDSFFTFGYVPGPQTVARGVMQLEAGHMLVWHDASAELRRYWRPPVHAGKFVGGSRQIVAELGELLEISVRGRLLSDVPIGVFLSGGIDSTLVGAIASRLAGPGLKTFSVGYDVGRVDETAPARAAATAIGSDHGEVVLGQAEVAVRAPAALGLLDQPLADPAFVALHALSEFARSEVTVAVGGEGADELFGGYPRYQWLTRAAHVGEYVGSARASRLRRAPINASRLGRLVTVAAGEDPFAAHVDWVTADRSMQRARIYGPRLRELVGRNGHSTRLRSRVADSGDDLAGALMRLDQLVWLTDDVLVKADRASMQTSLELRTPYLSRELAEFASSIPAATHVRGGGKPLLREVLRHELPEAAHRRRKIAFRVPTAQWLRGPLVKQLEETVLYERGWFDAANVRGLLAEHAAGHDRSSVLWPLVALSSWMSGAGSVYA